MMKIGLTLLVALAASFAGCVGVPGPGRAGHRITLDLGDGVTMDLVRVPAGSFLMGSPATEEGREIDEGPQRAVTITKPFYIGTTEVTRGQWKAVMGTEPWEGWDDVKDDPKRAASSISWDVAAAFCARLSQLIDRAVGLPTEAQWEYACRAGSTTRFSYGDDPDFSRLGEHAWYSYNAESEGQDYAHKVGQKKPNAWGLYDMHGNVFEWCRDWYGWRYYSDMESADPEDTTRADYRVFRGGSWCWAALSCRSASRHGSEPSLWLADCGFRVVVSVDDED